jgi:hypothetical protein
VERTDFIFRSIEFVAEFEDARRHSLVDFNLSQRVFADRAGQLVDGELPLVRNRIVG